MLKKRTKKELLNLGLGLLQIVFVIFSIWCFNYAKNYGAFSDVTLWTTSNIQPHLSGNYAVDKQIVRSAGEFNFTIMFFIAIMFGTMVMIFVKGCLKVKNSLIPKSKRK